MKFGLTEWEFQFIQDNDVKPLHERGAIVWCFGSRARGCHQKFSDLDLLVESVDNLAPLLAELRDFLEESNFP
jgi:predicted nucleotidyltransferase